jgi:hypothetical protein
LIILSVISLYEDGVLVMPKFPDGIRPNSGWSAMFLFKKEMLFPNKLQVVFKSLKQRKIASNGSIVI